MFPLGGGGGGKAKSRSARVLLNFLTRRSFGSVSREDHLVGGERRAGVALMMVRGLSLRVNFQFRV